MQMATITECDVSECSYNSDNLCHALAVTIGGGLDHMCDTRFISEQIGGDPDSCAGVGACRSTGCLYNQSLECSAPEVRVGHLGVEADCLTFRPK